MVQTIESYPALMNAYVTMVACNGGLNRNRPLNTVLRASDQIIGAEGVDHETLVAIDGWLATLTDDQILDFVDGDEDDKDRLVSLGGEIGQRADGLLEDLFSMDR